MPEPGPATVLRVEERTLLLAELGPVSSLPVVYPTLAQPYGPDEEPPPDIPAEMAAGFRYGGVPNIFPYQLQDGYGRDVLARQVPAVVLENARLRAVFLPSLGGRLWELYDKVRGKHLLHTQQRIQFANLALRNAWFAGGVEWNIGTRGHSPSTCSPLHAAIVRTPEGTEILRMWEFERLREVVFQIDAWLPADSDALFVAVRIRNPNAREVPMYWWSNAAVPETAGTRVIAPAGAAYATDSAAGISRVRPTSHRGVDASWPVRNAVAADYFFDLDSQQRPWIAAADDDGDGLALLSSPRLRGRKLFVWGSGEGGRRWQDWLSPGSGHYAEIQAGLAQTQYQHVPMAAGAAWSWVEAYGNAQMDPGPAHSSDWPAAVGHAEAKVEQLVPAAELAAALAAAGRWADLAPDGRVLSGSGWGALEALRRARSGAGWIDETGTPFSAASLDAQQRPWLELLDGRGFSGSDSFVAGSDWEELLSVSRPVPEQEPAPVPEQESVQEPGSACGPDAAFHLAVMHHARQELAPARLLYERTLAGKRHSARTAALAHRGLGLVLLALEEVQAGLDQLAAACARDPGNVPLLAEAMSLQLRHGAPEVALDLAGRAPEAVAAVGRIRYLAALGQARAGHAAKAAAMLRAGIEVADLREGENCLAALWLEVCPGEEIPAQYQFSMQ